MRPELVRENGDVIFACDAFFGEEVAAQEKGASEHVVVARSYLKSFDIFRLVFAGEIDGIAGVRLHRLKRGVLLLPIDNVLRGDSSAIAVQLGPDGDELVRFRVGKRCEKCCVVDREDGRIRAYAERESEENGECEARVFAQHAEGMAEILKHSKTSLSCTVSAG